MTPQDAILSDQLNHASLIDGIRLCKAKRYRYQHNDMNALEDQLKAARQDGAKHMMIATDGVFSMDGYLADLPGITQLAKRYGALVVVDDCHGVGFMGPNGAGTPSHFNVDVDVLTGTFGKALGGSIGGYVAGPQALISLLRQRSRPYLFSNSIPPSMAASSLSALHLVKKMDGLRHQLFHNTQYWRNGLQAMGFDVLPGAHPIVPVMLGEAKLAQQMAASLFDQGVYVTGFAFPVVPHGQARIRTQMNAALSQQDLDHALNAFKCVGQSLGVIS